MGWTTVKPIRTSNPAAASSGKYHHCADVGEEGDEKRRQSRTEAQQDVEGGQGHIPAVGHEGPGVGADRTQGQAEPQPQGAVATSSIG